MKLKIGYLSPLPPDRTGVAHYNACLLPYLAKLADLTLFAANRDNVNLDGLEESLSIEPMDALHDLWLSFDVLIYHMGNSRTHHREIYELATMYGGIVVLHDYGLHHFVAEERASFPDLYLREMGYADGRTGFQEGWWVLKEMKSPSYFDIPLNRRLLEGQLGIVVHSAYTEQRILDFGGPIRTNVIPHLDTNGLLDVPPFLKSELGVSDDSILIMIAGQITINKQVDFFLRTFAQLRQNGVGSIRCVIVGEPVAELDLDQIAQSFGIADSLIQVGFVPDHETFMRWLSTADIVVNLRHPTLGETSGVVLQSLALGRPTVVFDHGWYSELDDGACVKTPVMDQDRLYDALKRLIEDGAWREQIGRAGQSLIQEKHHPADVARAYIDFAMQVAKNL